MIEQNILNLDIIQFFTKVNGFQPTPMQAELLLAMLDQNVSQIAVCCGRQTGKSLTVATGIIYLSLHSNLSIILVSAQSNWIYHHVTQIFNKNPELHQYIKWEGKKSIVPLTGYETNFGSIVHLRASTEKSLRGVPATIGILDEAELISDEIIGTVEGSLSGKFKLLLIGTPPRNHKGIFYEVIRNPVDRGYLLFKWSAEDCSWHSKKELDMKRKDLGIYYDEEVKGELLPEAQRGIVAEKDVDACVKSIVLRGTGTKEVGIDWGSGGRCKTVLIVIERTKSAHIKGIFIKSWNKEQIGNLFTELAEILKFEKPDKLKVDAFPQLYADDLKKVYTGRTIYRVSFGEIYKSATHKERMLEQLIHKIQTHSLEIPDNNEEWRTLIRQLKTYRRGKQYQDDYVDALCLALYEDKDLFKPATAGVVAFPRDYEKRNREALHEW